MCVLQGTYAGSQMGPLLELIQKLCHPHVALSHIFQIVFVRSTNLYCMSSSVIFVLSKDSNSNTAHYYLMPSLIHVLQCFQKCSDLLCHHQSHGLNLGHCQLTEANVSLTIPFSTLMASLGITCHIH